MKHVYIIINDGPCGANLWAAYTDKAVAVQKAAEINVNRHKADHVFIVDMVLDG